MKKSRILIISVLIVVVIIFYEIFNNYYKKEEKSMVNEIKINVIVNDKVYSGVLYESATVEELISKLPITLDMSELNNNEKYAYLDFTLTTHEYNPGMINAGDIKLYGNNCIVIFYDTFSSSYKYTDLGKIEESSEFVSELKSGNVKVTIELNND